MRLPLVRIVVSIVSIVLRVLKMLKLARIYFLFRPLSFEHNFELL